MIDLGKVIGGDMEQQIAKDEAKRLRRILQEQSAPQNVFLLSCADFLSI